MSDKKILNLGIGFATGRKNFKNVLKTYIYNWKESGLIEDNAVRLNLFIAYDLKYSKTKMSDFTKIKSDLLDMIGDAYFIGKNDIHGEANLLLQANVLNAREARLFFKGGYAGQRNAILYFAIKNKTDFLFFLDDDEYPIAVTKNRATALWSGQHVLDTHLEYIKHADITHGYHCGYISPIPNIKFSEILTETDFRLFIEAISNDIINWENIKTVMKNGGATYADTNVLMRNEADEVMEINKTKFISGANLCMNLTDPKRVYAFYNPPGARGEDTFLSTMLSDRKVIKVPCYTFHDGFGTYHYLLDGVLPIRLKSVEVASEAVIDRFYRACIGWIRYKPLFVYITQKEKYSEKIKDMKEKLAYTLPKICSYFGNDSFRNLSAELERYHKHVQKHYAQYLEMKNIWEKIKSHLSSR